MTQETLAKFPDMGKSYPDMETIVSSRVVDISMTHS
jgi:hypothetical protein